MPISISPTIADIDINGHTYTHTDWETNTPGVLSGLGNDISSRIAALDLVGILTKSISGNTTLSGPESTNIGFVFTGTLSSNANITFAAGFEGIAQIENQTSGGYAIVCGLVAGDTVFVPTLGSAAAFCDGTNFSLQSGIVRTSVGASITGDFQITGNLDVSGDTDFAGTVNFGDAADFDSTVSVAGALSGATGNFASNVTVGGVLAVTGAAGFNSSATVTGAFSVTGASSLSSLSLSGYLAGHDADFDTVVLHEPAAETRLLIGADAGNSAWVQLGTGSSASQRWLMGKDDTSEGGGNSGSDWHLVCFADDGTTALFIPIQVIRSSGNIIMNALPTSSAGLATGTLWNNSGVLNVA